MNKCPNQSGWHSYHGHIFWRGIGKKMTEEGVREVKESLENGGHPCPHQSNDTFGGMKVPVAVTAV